MTREIDPWFVVAPEPPQWPEGWARELPCQADPEAWFPGGGQVPTSIARACWRQCPRRDDCLAYALDVFAAAAQAGASLDEFRGVWGGYGVSDVERIAAGGQPVAQDCGHPDEDWKFSGGRYRCVGCRKGAELRRYGSGRVAA